MADWAKIAIKTGLVATIMIGLWAVFSNINVPTQNIDTIASAVSFGLKFMEYWCPVFPFLWGLSLTLLGVLIALWTFRYSMIAVRWLFKVNE